MKILEMLRKAVAPKVLFNDKVRVYTTEYGTQYIDPEGVFRDREALEEIRRFSERMRTARLRELEAELEDDLTETN